MRNCHRLVPVVAIAFFGFFVTQNASARCKSRKCHSRQNEASAKAYCATQKKQGVECMVKRGNLLGCGKDWQKAKKWGGKGKDYIACVRSRRYLGTQDNKREADQYCAAERAKGVECRVVKGGIKGCGTDWTMAKRFGGTGKNYLACKRTARYLGSTSHKASCDAYCNEKQSRCKEFDYTRTTQLLPCECDCKCTTGLLCGIGWKRVKSWRGKGKNWHACGRTAAYVGTRKSQKACEEWCQQHGNIDRKKGCLKCVKARPTNGTQIKLLEDYVQYKVLKKFKGKGRNWHAVGYKSGDTIVESPKIKY